MLGNKFKPTVSTGCAVALQLLKAVDSAAGSFGPLKAVTGPALYIAETVQQYQSHRKDWTRFSEHVQETLVTLLQRIHDAEGYEKGALLRDMEKLRDALNKIKWKMEEYERKRHKWWYFLKKPHFIEDLRKDFEEAILAFKMEISLSSALDIAEIQRLLEEQNLQPFLDKLDLNLTRAMTAINLSNLPVGDSKTTWNYDDCCLEGTRIEVLNDILEWLSDGEAGDKPRIRLLTDVAGSGKSAVAHSVAKLCKEKGILASSFFFDREISGQNDTTKLFTSIAHDLAKLDERLGLEISNALSKQSARNCLRDEFQFFILEPLARSPLSGPRAIIIDALDESGKEHCDISLLKLLKDDISKLPSSFRLFITTRPEPDVMRHLESLSHIQISDLDIDGAGNRADVSRYSRFRFDNLSKTRRITNWPSEQQLKDFEVKAEGLMLFVSTLSDFLEIVHNPERQLKLMLLEHTPKDLASTSKMDQLYDGITNHCLWNDPTFVTDYQAVVGIVVAVKRPITMETIQALLDTSTGNEIRAERILCETLLRTLLLGCTTKSQPVKTLHLSFREFLTNSKFPRTFIDEKRHNQHLTLHCLRLMNQRLSTRYDGLGYLAEDVPYDPLPSLNIPAEVEYACLFWMEHLDAYDDLAGAPGVVTALKEFLSRHIIAWLEITISTGRFQSLLNDRVLHALEIISAATSDSFLHPDLPDTLHRVTKRLANLNRYDEALQCSWDTIHFMHLRVGHTPPEFDAPLGFALVGHTRVLVNNFRYQEAVLFAQQSLDWLCTVSVDDRSYAICRSRLLHNMSAALERLSRFEEATEALKEAISIQEALPTIETYEMLRDLPMFTCNLARFLEKSGDLAEALETASRAVKLYRQYADTIPDFRIHLVPALVLLSNVSARFPDQATQALKLAEEAVDLNTELLASFPSAECDLADSLKAYASRLDRTDPEKAIHVTERVVELLRKQVGLYSGTFTWHLALALQSLTSRLCAQHRYQSALEHIQECTVILKSMHASDNPHIERKLAFSLLVHSRLVRMNSQLEMALSLAQEAAERYRTVAAISRDEQDFSHLGQSLEELSIVRRTLAGQGTVAHHEVEAAMTECVSVYRTLAEKNEVFVVQLLRHLRRLSNYLRGRKRSVDAEALIKEIYDIEHPSRAS